MNLLKNTAAAGLLAASSLLTGSPTQAAPAEAASLAEALGLPLNEPRAHFNEMTQTAFEESCKIKGDIVRCTLDVKANGALLDYKQNVDYMIGSNGNLTIETNFLGLNNEEWSPDIYTYDYKPIADEAAISEWSAKSPLAHLAADGSGRVVQNDGWTVTLLDDDIADVRSSVPVNESRGFDIHTIFNGYSGHVQSYVVPRVSFDNSVIEATPARPAQRDMIYSGTYVTDASILENYVTKASQKGGQYDFFAGS